MTLTASRTTIATDRRTDSTRCFWVGMIIGAAAGFVLGHLLGDMLGWTYMVGVSGTIAGIAFDQK